MSGRLPTELTLVNQLLLDRMRRDNAAQLGAYFDCNLPNPAWVEELLQGLSKVPTTESVLKLIRADPSQTMRHCTTLSVGLYLVRNGMDVEFQDVATSRNFDLAADGALAVEVKHLDDISNWSPLSRRIMEIPSSYLVNVSTDVELTEKQADGILAEICAAVAVHSEPSFRLGTANAEMHFTRVESTTKTLPMLSSRTFGVDLPALRRLFISRIEDAKGQLKTSKLLKFAAIDIDRSRFFSDTTRDVFCGSVVWHFSKPGFQYLGGSRMTDGVLSEPSFWDGIDGVLVFYGYDSGARRIAYYQSPEVIASRFPAQLGKPDTCP